MILQGVKLTIQPLGVGYANSPKKAKMGGYVAFYPIYAFLAFMVTNCISRLCTNPLGDPPPLDLIPKSGEKHVNTA